MGARLRCVWPDGVQLRRNFGQDKLPLWLPAGGAVLGYGRVLARWKEETKRPMTFMNNKQGMGDLVVSDCRMDMILHDYEIYIYTYK